MNNQYIVASIIILVAIGISITLSPHFVRVVCLENETYLASRTQTKAQVKLKQISPEEIKQRFQSSSKDTILVHLWNSWHSEGTRYFSQLTRYMTDHNKTTDLIHVCTDINGIRQVRGSALIAEKYGVRGLSFVIRARASILDLHNNKATSEFICGIAGKQMDQESPQVLRFRRDGSLLGTQSVGKL